MKKYLVSYLERHDHTYLKKDEAENQYNWLLKQSYVEDINLYMFDTEDGIIERIK